MPTNPPPERTVPEMSKDAQGIMAAVSMAVGGGVLIWLAFAMGHDHGRHARVQEILEAAGVCDDMNAMGFGDLPGPGGFYTDANCRTIRNIALEKKFYDDGKG